MLVYNPRLRGCYRYLILQQVLLMPWRDKKKKINLFLADVDPFLLLEKKTRQRISFSELPPVDASDLVSYLVLQTSYLTAKQFKSHKSHEAYNQFVSGWVKEVVAWSVTEINKLLVTGRVIVDTI